MSDDYKAMAGAVTDSQRQAPPRYTEAVREHAERLNLPRLGPHKKAVAGSFQLNLAPAESDACDVGLSASMGLRFGGKHEDDDEIGVFSTLVVLSDHPTDYDPGRFFFPMAQVYVTCNKFTCVNFSGRHFHGSSPITGPDGHLDPSAIRAVGISYPPRHLFSGNGRFPLANLYDGTRWNLGKEMKTGG